MAGTTFDRRRTPEETLAWVRPHLAAMGITRIADVSGLDRLRLPIAQAIRPNARSISVAQGKGTSLAAAKASAVMESIEGWHAENAAPPVETVPRRALDGRAGTVAAAALTAAKDHVPDEDEPVDCVPGEELIGVGTRLVPFDLVHTDYTRPPESFRFHCSSNGLAAGNTILEATISALTEVIERDALAGWNAMGPEARQATRIAAHTIDLPLARAWIERAEAAGIEVMLWNATSDIGVPVVLCRFWERDPDEPSVQVPAFGAGCHPRRGIALMRALAEAAQGRVVTISGARDDLDAQLYLRAPREKQILRLLGGLTRPPPPGRPFATLPDRAPAPLEDDLDWLLARLAAAGLGQAVRVDLTRPGIGIPVVRMVVPGMGAPLGHSRFVLGSRRRGRIAA